MFILDDLFVKLPAKGLMAVFKKIAEMAEAEMDDDTKIREQLQQLEFLFETDQISEEEFEKREAELMERLTIQEEKRGDVGLMM
jgi:hypothetical protein